MEQFSNHFKGNSKVRIVGYIFETDDYSLFEKLEGNRDAKKSIKLKKSMEENGFLNIPVVINEKNEICDGQHRVMTAEELHLPVRFVVEPKMGIDQTSVVNTTQNPWKIRNYVDMSTVTGSEDYRRFKLLCEKFPFALFNTIYVAMGANLTGGGVDKIIKDKRLVCTEQQYEEACKMLSWLETFNADLKKQEGQKITFTAQ